MSETVSEQPILEMKNVHSGYGSIKALKGISLKVMPGEIVAMIGANGAGKSTTLMTICGIVAAEQGEVWYDGKKINKVSPEKLPTMGLCQVPEGRRIFPRLSVEENLILGAFHRNDKDGISKDIQHAYDLFPILGERQKQEGGTLSGGEQQMLAIGRALMARPKLLVLDEPSMGLAPKIVDMIFTTIETLRDQGTTILLVEQNARAALKISDRGYVLETGKMVLQGSAEELLVDDDVKRAYLGHDYGDFYDGREN